jgi:hypothetical protein
MDAVAAAGAVGAWAGGALLVFSEGRRGLAAGVAATGLGLAASLVTHPLPAILIAAASVLAAALRLRDGRPGWAVLPPGSTPRLMLAVLTGVLGAFAGATLMTAPEPAAARVAIVVAGALATARLLSTSRRGPALAALSGLCLVLAALEAIISPASPALVAAPALAAVAIGLLPATEEAADGA